MLRYDFLLDARCLRRPPQKLGRLVFGGFVSLYPVPPFFLFYAVVLREVLAVVWRWEVARVGGCVPCVAVGGWVVFLSFALCWVLGGKWWRSVCLMYIYIGGLCYGGKCWHWLGLLVSQLLFTCYLIGGSGDKINLVYIRKPFTFAL